MSEREPIGKKLRFEVFKRDRFICQYCGAKAPEAVLHVDHINPVAKGGGNELVNLITACAACNGGKGARLLSDSTAVEKQRFQIEELQDRREQLEMLMEWRERVKDIAADEEEAVVEVWNQLTGRGVTDYGRELIRKWIKRYGVKEVIEGFDSSCETYLRTDDASNFVPESFSRAFEMVPRVISGKKKYADKPYMKDIFYIRGILRNRLDYVNEWLAVQECENAYLVGVSLEALKDAARYCRSWSNFRNIVGDLIDDLPPEQDAND